jgi:fatty acid/phospholipid biosynthesis enzyme
LNPYAEKARGEKNPKIRLLSNGTDNELIKHTHTLKDSGLSFYGNIEGKEIIGGKV